MLFVYSSRFETALDNYNLFLLLNVYFMLYIVFYKKSMYHVEQFLETPPLYVLVRPFLHMYIHPSPSVCNGKSSLRCPAVRGWSRKFRYCSVSPLLSLLRCSVAGPDVIYFAQHPLKSAYFNHMFFFGGVGMDVFISLCAFEQR